jgi:hypothetical protein
MEGNSCTTHNFEEIVTKYLTDGNLQAIRRINIVEGYGPPPGLHLSLRGGIFTISVNVTIGIGRLAATIGAATAGIWTLIEILEWVARHLRGPGP